MKPEERKRLFNKDVPFITYIIHDKNMKNGRTVTVYKPTQEYYILFELIKFRRLPSTFPDIGITVISEGLEPSPSDVSMTQDVLTPIKTSQSNENTSPDYYKEVQESEATSCKFCGSNKSDIRMNSIVCSGCGRKIGNVAPPEVQE